MAARWVVGIEPTCKQGGGPVSTYRDWPFRWLRIAWRLGVGVWLVLGTACKDTPAAFGPSRAVARVRANELFTGLTQRFTNVDRSPQAVNSLTRIDRAVFNPSHVFDDSAVWNVLRTDSVRAMMLVGRVVDDRYVVAQVNEATAPRDLAASRDEIRLARVGHDQYQWSTRVDQALGSPTPEDVGRIVSSMLAAPAATNEDVLRTETLAAFPRTSVVMGRLFSIDSLQRTPREDGTALVNLVLALHPDGLQTEYPAFATYLRTYLNPLRLRSVVRDAAGGEWFDLDLGGNRLRLRFRADREGHLAPLDGEPRPMPDSVLLVSDFHTKVWLFSIGMTELTSEVTLMHSAQTFGAALSFQQEPRWHLPLAVSHFVKGSLRRPFEGPGARYRMSVSDADGNGTLLLREGDVTVQQSMIMRWFGGLGTHAFREFYGPAEVQESAYLASVFSALRDDVDAALMTPATVAGEVDAGAKKQ
jgi:hypothetical protein